MWLEHPDTVHIIQEAWQQNSKNRKTALREWNKKIQQKQAEIEILQNRPSSDGPYIIGKKGSNLLERKIKNKMGGRRGPELTLLPCYNANP